MRIYATEQDLIEWPVEQTGHEKAALRAASSLVEGATLTALYAVEADGMPADPDVRAAFRDAVCTQVEAWAALGIDPRKGAAGATAAGVVTGKSIGGASITRTAHARAGDDRAVAVSALTGQAVTILRGVLPCSAVRAVD